MKDEKLTQAIRDYAEAEGYNVSILSRAVGLKSQSLGKCMCTHEYSYHTVLQLAFLIPYARNLAIDEVLDRLESAAEWYEESTRKTQERYRRQALKKTVQRITANPPIYARAW
jgi:hypothetical protein